MKTTTKTRELNVIYESKNNMYTPMLEVTAGGGGGGARAPVPPPSESAPGRLGLILCYGTKRDACYMFICLQYRSATSPIIFALNLAVSFWLKHSVSTFDWNFWCRDLTETFDCISLSTFDWNFW